MTDHIAAMSDNPSSDATAQPAASPCVLICQIESTTGYCWGCGRTIEEIGGWSVYPEAKRSTVMLELPERMRSLPERPKRVTKRRARTRTRDRTTG